MAAVLFAVLVALRVLNHFKNSSEERPDAPPLPMMVVSVSLHQSTEFFVTYFVFALQLATLERYICLNMLEKP